MNLADLFVRVRGDTSDVTEKFRRLGDSFGKLESASKSSHVSLGRLGNAFESLTSRIVGVNPVVGKLAAVLSEFSVGGALTVGILAGATAIAVAWDKLTESSRKAMEVGDKLAKTYQEEARIMALGIGGKYKADIEDLTKAMQENVKWTDLLNRLQTQGGPVAAAASLFTGGLDKRREALSRGLQQAQIDQMMAEFDAQDEAMIASVKLSTSNLNDQLEKEREITAEKARQQALVIQYSELMRRTYGTLGTIGHDFAGPAIDPLQRMQEAERSGQAMAAKQLAALGVPQFSMPNIPGPFEGLTDAQKDTLRQLGVLTDKADKNADTIANAVLSGAGIIVNALNIGGGGRGSGIGGALGSIVGTAGGSILASHIGSTFGSLIAPGVGTIVGSLAGSLLGGLFDHRKAVDNNTAALNRVANLLNAPSGFKAAYYTYNAEDARRVYRQQVEAARREGTRGGNIGFAFQAGA